MATHDNDQFLKLCGLRDSYPGNQGVGEVNALADLIFVDGNPTEDISLVADPEKNFLVIMKDSKIYRNDLK